MSSAGRDVERLLGEISGLDVETLRVEALVTLVDNAHAALVDLGPPAALPAICAALLRVMGCTTAVVSLVDEGERALFSVAGVDVGGVQTRVEGRRPLITHPTLERVVGERLALFTRPGEGAGEATAGSVSGDPSRCLALPLVVRGESIGVVELLAAEGERRYSVAELKLAEGVCESVAAAAGAVFADERGRAHDASAAETRSQPQAAGTTPAEVADSGAAAAPDVAGGSDDGSGEISRQLDGLVRRLADGVGVAHADILVRQAPGGSLKVVAHHGAGEVGLGASRVREYGLGETGARGAAIASRAVVCVRDDDDALEAEERAEMAARRERAVMYVPIVSHDAVVGLLAAIETRLPRRFTPAEEAFAQQIAWEAAVAVDSARIVEQLGAQNREMSLLLETGAAIAGSVDLHETLSTISRLLVETLGAAWCNVYDYDAGRGDLEVTAFHQIPGIKEDPDWIGRRFGPDDWNDGLACVDERRPRTAYYDWSKLTPEEFAFMEPWGEKALMIVPILHGDEVLGAIDVAESRYPRRFTPEEIHLAEAIANQAAVAIRNARLYDDATRLYAEARDRNSELETIIGASEALGSTVDLNLLLKAICWRVKDVLGSASVEAYEYSPESDELVYRDHAADDDYWNAETEWAGVYAVSAHPTIERCVRGHETVVLTVDGDDVPEVTRAEMLAFGQASEMWVPMVYKDEVMGVLSISELSPERRFDDAEVRIAAAIASQGAAAIANARAYLAVERERARLQRLNQRLRAFTELSAGVRGLVGEADLLHTTGRVMSEALGFRQWVAYLHDPEARRYVVPAAIGSPSADIDEHYRSTPVPEHVIAGLVGDARRISQSFFVDHNDHVWTDEENRYLPGVVQGEPGEGEWGNDDTLLVPMYGQAGGLIGYLEAYDPVDRQLPDEETVRLLEVFAARAAAAVELARAHAELEDQSRTDGLTGLFNHRYFQERVQDEVARAVRTHRPLTVLMIDVDDFKEFNDTHGHPQGDRLLKALAGLLTEQTRQRIDFVARYGGEEFVVVLPDTGLGAAQTTAARLRDEFDDGLGETPPDAGDATGGTPPGAGDARTAEQVAEAIRCATEQRALASVALGGEGSVTISIGMAAYPEHGQTADQLIANADKALYLAKRLGKNRTCVYEG